MGKLHSCLNHYEIFGAPPRPTNSGVSEGLGRGPFIKMKRLLFHWERGWGIPPIYYYIYQKISPPKLDLWSHVGAFPSRSGGGGEGFQQFSRLVASEEANNSTKTYQENH